MTLNPDEFAHLARAVQLAGDARSHGNHPFGAILVTASGTTIEAENTVLTAGDPTGHAETNLVRLASASLGADEVGASTLYTSTEPCAMCCGAIFWAGIPRVVYALAESELVAMNPPEHTLSLPSRDIFARGGRATAVSGPHEVPGVRAVHDGFWS